MTHPRTWDAVVVPSTFWEGYARRHAQPQGTAASFRAQVAVLSALDIAGELYRHQRGNRGEMGKEDARANERALKQGERLLSVYKPANGTRFWVTTEWDRLLTTVLLPEDC